MSAEKISTTTLTAELIFEDWAVVDPDGGTWHPTVDAQRDIKSTLDPAATAVRMCRLSPMRGTWTA